MTFGMFIKRLREHRELSMRELERQSGVSQSYLSQIESGKRNTPEASVIKKLSTVLDFDYVELLIKSGILTNEDINNYNKGIH